MNCRPWGPGLLAISDVRYHKSGRRRLTDVLTAVRLGTTVDALGHAAEPNAERYLRPPVEVARLFPRHPAAVANTLRVLDATAGFSLDQLRYEYLDEILEEGRSAQQTLEARVVAAFDTRWPKGVSQAIRDRIAHELRLIEQLGYAPYFLTVHEIVRFAQRQQPPILCQGRAMGLTADVTARLAKASWGPGQEMGFADLTAGEGLDPAASCLQLAMELAEELIDFLRHVATHVGGFVITRGPLIELAVVTNAAMADRTALEWDKDDIEVLGTLKVDILGLGMLSCLCRSFDLLRQHASLSLDLALLPKECAETYAMLCRADSVGVFQVESRAQMNMLPHLQPQQFYDFVIEVAIVRPGPIAGGMVHPFLRRKSRQESEEYPSPLPLEGAPDELYQVLHKTLGVPLFQEQAMRIAIVAARFTPMKRTSCAGRWPPSRRMVRSRNTARSWSRHGAAWLRARLR